MKPDQQFTNQPKHFWAYVRTISQEVGYTIRRKKAIKIPTLSEVKDILIKLDLVPDQIIDRKNKLTGFGKTLFSYFKYRADQLNRYVEPRLMNADQAARLFEALRNKLRPKCPIPMNKQKGEKKSPAYLTGIVNMLIEANAEGFPCDYDPRTLTTFTKKGFPLRTLARRIDGAFPTGVNPVAVWEIKEYYYTTTFGSRVADGVYETLLDGMELKELSEQTGIDVRHYLIVDAHYTWWECGRSYLCRIIDMLHMGYVDEVLFGTEVVERMPSLVKEWLTILNSLSKSK